MPSKAPREEDIEIGEAPTSIDPYAVLGVPKDADEQAIKTAYRKAALRHHPDKALAEDKESAHTKFQEIAFAYAILSDPRRRKRYDTTGRTEETLDLGDDDFDWTEFFRTQFAEVVTTERVESFAKEYKGGEEERDDLLAAYTKFNGRMSKIYESVMLSDVLEDDERFRGIIDQAIRDGEVEDYKSYSQESEKSKKARVAAAKRQREVESKEVEEAKEEIHSKRKAKDKGSKDSGLGDLAAMIQQRQKGRAENFFDNLEAKYASSSKKSKRPADDEPSEEAFAKNRAKGKAGPSDTSQSGRKSKRTKQ